MNDKFDQMYEDEEQRPEYALIEEVPSRKLANNMNAEPTAQLITFKSKLQQFQGVEKLCY